MTSLKEDSRKEMPVTANPAGLTCPLPLPHEDHILLGHGSGGLLTHRLIRDMFLEAFDNPALRRGDDAAVLALEKPGRLALTTDAHIVSPLFFPGGDIGRLAICGTVNDLAVLGAQPRWLTASFILEEGLPMADLRRVVDSMRRAADEAGVQVVAGDTKVAERGKADGLFIQTTGVGTIPEGRDVGGALAQPGDAVLVSGPLGDHGMAVLSARGQLGFTIDVESDVAPLNGLIEAVFASGAEIHVMRDPTRGGLATTLNEIARQSGVSITLEEASIPVRPAVASACELLGFDPLYVANEGRLIVIAAAGGAAAALKALRGHPLGAEAQPIGVVEPGPAGRVRLRTRLGTTRVVEMLSGEMLPRIC
jgi:hydrogenase expression/formation protein HypE